MIPFPWIRCSFIFIFGLSQMQKKKIIRETCTWIVIRFVKRGILFTDQRVDLCFCFAFCLFVLLFVKSASPEKATQKKNERRRLKFHQKQIEIWKIKGGQTKMRTKQYCGRFGFHAFEIMYCAHKYFSFHWPYCHPTHVNKSYSLKPCEICSDRA